MRLFRLEHSATGYALDFALYGTGVVLLSVFVAGEGPRTREFELAALTLAGLAGWTLIEYVMHRYILHGPQPFHRWHLEHHQRPKALIYAPAMLIVPSILVLVYLPVLLLSDRWCAYALTLGVLTGYLGYSVVHHAVHHWRSRSRWLKRRQHWHALHHRPIANPGHYGVTTGVWDHVFRTAGREGTGRSKHQS